MPRHSFHLDARGVFTRDQLRITWQDEVRPAHPLLDALVERTWTEQMEQARKAGRVLFNGPLARCLRHRVRNGLLELEVGPTDYREFMGTNFVNWQRMGEFGPKLYSNPVGTSALLATRDGWLVLGRRSERVACLPGYVHTFGGCLEPGEKRPDGTFDGFASTARELKEELAIEEADIMEMNCLGLVRDATFYQPELVFDAHVSLELDDLARRIRPGEPEEEHTEVVGCRDGPDALLPFIRNTTLIAPVAVGALVVHGARVFGEAWYRRVLAELQIPDGPAGSEARGCTGARP